MEYVNAAKEALRLGHRGYRYLTRNKRSNSSRVIKIHTEFMLSVTLSSGAASLSLSEATALSVDLASLGDLYRMFRFTGMSIEFPAPNWTTGVFLSCYFVPSAVAGSSTFDNVEANRVVLVSANQTVPSRGSWTRAQMGSVVPWFLTNAAATDPSLEVQGVLNFQTSSSSTEVIYFKLSIDAEFKDLFDPGVVLANLRLFDKTRTERIEQLKAKQTEGKSTVLDTDPHVKGCRCNLCDIKA